MHPIGGDDEIDAMYAADYIPLAIPLASLLTMLPLALLIVVTATLAVAAPPSAARGTSICAYRWQVDSLRYADRSERYATSSTLQCGSECPL